MCRMAARVLSGRSWDEQDADIAECMATAGAAVEAGEGRAIRTAPPHRASSGVGHTGQQGRRMHNELRRSR
jgi:hypothetical protein